MFLLISLVRPVHCSGIVGFFDDDDDDEGLYSKGNVIWSSKFFLLINISLANNSVPIQLYACQAVRLHSGHRPTLAGEVYQRCALPRGRGRGAQCHVRSSWVDCILRFQNVDAPTTRVINRDIREVDCGSVAKPDHFR